MRLKLQASSISNAQIWFTSDWHLGHKNIITYGNRPFSGVAEMERVLIENVQQLVEEKDFVFHLGDFCRYSAISERVIPQLPGTWFWIRGNHDKELEKYLKQVGQLSNLYDILDLTIGDQPITLCHYPMISWNKSHFGAWQLYGHHHSDTNILPIMQGKRLNVNVELWNYLPLSLNMISTIMNERLNNWDYIERR